jgi:hypothetical protein
LGQSFGIEIDIDALERRRECSLRAEALVFVFLFRKGKVPTQAKIELEWGTPVDSSQALLSG